MSQTATKTAPMAVRSSTSAASGARPGSVSRDAIATLAYQKWKQRGCPRGDDQRDWFEAEQELTAARTGQRQSS